MHSAPPVRYPIKPSRLRQACEGGVFILALVCLGLWAFQTEPSMLRGLVALCLCLPGLLFLVRSAFGTHAGELAWEGAAWTFHVQAHEDPVWVGVGTLDVLLDLQLVLLLRWRSAGVRGGKWIWLERRSEPSRWHLLRCAVYSRAAPAPSKEPIGP
jgi:hypothetical protein